MDKSKEIYTESKVVGDWEITGSVTSFDQLGYERHAVTVTKYHARNDEVIYFVDALMAYPSSDPAAVRHCIAAFDECIAQIERMQPVQVDPADTNESDDTNEPPF